jgi:hypothetical protein
MEQLDIQGRIIQIIVNGKSIRGVMRTCTAKDYERGWRDGDDIFEGTYVNDITLHIDWYKIRASSSNCGDRYLYLNDFAVTIKYYPHYSGGNRPSIAFYYDGHQLRTSDCKWEPKGYRDEAIYLQK